jgi:hypothetical protein
MQENYRLLTYFAVMLPSLLVIVLPFARDDVGVEQHHDMMIFEPLNPYAITYV